MDNEATKKSWTLHMPLGKEGYYYCTKAEAIDRAKNQLRVHPVGTTINILSDEDNDTASVTLWPGRIYNILGE